jgi:hypothetical protein
MTFVFGDNVRETVNITTPTATVPLGGAVPNSRAFSAVAANANTSWTVIRVGAYLSAGEFTFNTGSPNTLTQTTVRYSTNANSPVTFPSGPGEAFMDMPAYYALPLYFFGLGGNVWSVGINQGTNPVLSVDFNTASVATGVKFTGAAAAGGAALAVTSSGTNEGLKIDAKGSGTISIGSVSTGSILLARAVDISGASAGQIIFPATQNPSAGANTLDDYEEGTWTPANAFVTLTVSSASYTKVGRQVMLSYKVQWPTTADTHAAVITGVPFAAGNPGSGSIGYNSSGIALSTLVDASFSTIQIFNATTSATITNVNLTAAFQYGTVTYNT